jgi:hypothetical protein
MEMGTSVEECLLCGGSYFGSRYDTDRLIELSGQQ